MSEPLEIHDIAGLSLTIIGVLAENYIKEGYADPSMYKALRAAGELADQFIERAEFDNAPADFIEGVTELANNIKLTAMEAGEVVQKIIKDHGWEKETEGWDKPTACSNPDHDH